MRKMSRKFQIEFPETEKFQHRLKNLNQTFSKIAGEPIRINEIIIMCLKALSDITPELIDESKSDEMGPTAKPCFQKTSNIWDEDRALLDTIKLNLLLNNKRDISRKDIVRGIIYTANRLKESDISYILSEYQ